MAGSDAREEKETSNKQVGLPLAGVRVVDLTRVMVGPYCTMMLGDLGADVVKVEIPGRGDDTRHWGPPFVDTESVYYLSVNRNKRSIALDLKQDAAKDALWRLIDEADVLVENFSPGTLDRLGFGYDVVKARRPRIVYGAISGFGQSGPDYQRTAYDLIVQGTSGMMSITGHPGGPPTRLGVPIADIGGGMFAAYAIVAALFDRERSGEGSYVDISMLGGQVAMLTYQAGLYLSTGAIPGQLGNAHPMIAPYDTFPTADGYVNIAVGNESLWERFCTALDLTSLLEDERFANNSGRSTNREALYAMLELRLRTLTTDDVVRLLDTAGVPCGPIRDVAQTMDDGQTRAQDLVLEVEHPRIGTLRVPGGPYHFDGEPVRARLAPPLLGQQTAEILTEAGYSSEEIAALIASGGAQSGES
ncbi:MAG TPA: CoA transferase [Thermomicrobiales bacterium]|nr:CoA transferase [Thermomicrobiales bacterium]